MKNNKCVFVQFSSKLFENDVPALAYEYNESIYQMIPGYGKHEHFWEYPLWIAKLHGSIPLNVECRLLIVEDIDEALNGIDHHNTNFFFSVLDINKPYVKEFINRLIDIDKNAKIITGGYTLFNYENEIVKWYNSIESCIIDLYGKTSIGYNYSLFDRTKLSIPRLTITEGCKFNCKFCCVEKTITQRSAVDIDKQIRSFASLNFELVYIDDKTFDPNTLDILEYCYKYIKEYNKNFKGFIIQTIPANLKKLYYNPYIRYIEIGIEIIDDGILEVYNKPYKIKALESTMSEIICNIRYGTHVPKLIPNLIVGFPEATFQSYLATIEFIKSHTTLISHLNIFNLSIYNNSILSAEIPVKSKVDVNELLSDNTFSDRDLSVKAETMYYNLGTNLLNRHYEKENKT